MNTASAPAVCSRCQQCWTPSTYGPDAHGADEHLARVGARAEHALRVLEDRDARPPPVLGGQLEPDRGGAPRTPGCSPSGHSCRSRPSASEHEVDASRAGLEQARLDVLGHGDELGHDVGGRAVRRDAAPGELAKDRQALGRARDLRPSRWGDGGDLQRLAEHRVRVERAARVDLAGEVPVPVGPSPRTGAAERLGAEPHDLEVERPEDVLDARRSAVSGR